MGYYYRYIIWHDEFSWLYTRKTMWKNRFAFMGNYLRVQYAAYQAHIRYTSAQRAYIDSEIDVYWVKENLCNAQNYRDFAIAMRNVDYYESRKERKWEAFKEAERCYFEARAAAGRENGQLDYNQMYSVLSDELEDIVQMRVVKDLCSMLSEKYHEQNGSDEICTLNSWQVSRVLSALFSRNEDAGYGVQLHESETERSEDYRCADTGCQMQCRSRKTIIRKMGPGISHGPSVIPPFEWDGLFPAAMVDTSRRPLKKAA